MATADELLSDALQLSSKDRARLAHKLLLSLEEQTEEPGAEAAWADELERRAEDVVSGKARTYDARQTIEEVRAQLRERRGR
jgi:putative addiction module component (TIGR02574 family)